jgi:hypothetical protein
VRPRAAEVAVSARDTAPTGVAIDQLLAAIAVLDQQSDESMRDLATRCLIEAQVCEQRQRAAAAATWRAFMRVVVSVVEDHMVADELGG